MQETFAVILIVMTMLLILVAVGLLVFMILVAVFYRKTAKRVRIITNAVNRAVILDEPVRLDGVYVSQDEAQQIKDFLRTKKEREARDSATLDTATEFYRDH
jgi:hypothetical protein